MDIDINNLAPIVLFVYNRPKHTKQTLLALRNNILADKSVLYVYCDGPKINVSEDCLLKIKEVRSIVKSQNWCGKVIIIESDVNKGLATSIRTGVSEVINKHNSVIVMEDDLMTSKAFLMYMNKSLQYYKNRKSVFSISAYSLPKDKLSIPEDYKYDNYVCLRNSSWGWATWSDRWLQVDWSCRNYELMKSSILYQNAFNRRGDDVFEMLEQQQNGLDIWSIQFTLAHFENHAISMVPSISYVDNLGLDGSGQNCGVQESLKNKYLNMNENPYFVDILCEDERIINAFYSAYCRSKRPFYQKVINTIYRKLGKMPPYKIKKKIYN